MALKRVRVGTDSSGRPIIFDERMAYKVRLLQKKFPKLVVIQGSYSDADASAGIHKGGGTVDLRTWNLTSTEVKRVVRYARATLGLVAWYRTKRQGFDPHIHAVDAGNPTLAQGAKNQVASFRRGRNGLANNGPDDGPRVNLGTVQYPPAPTAPKLGRYVVTAGGANVRKLPRVKATVTRTLKAGESRVFVARRFNDDLWWLRTVAGSWIPLKDLKKK